MDLRDGQMSLLPNESNTVQLMISGSMNSLNCMLMTGRKNLGSRLVKGLSARLRVIVGQMLMTSKSSIISVGHIFPFCSLSPAYVALNNGCPNYHAITSFLHPPMSLISIWF